MIKFSEAIKSYMFPKETIVQLKPDCKEMEDNPLYYTGIASLIGLTDEQRANFDEWITYCEVEPGLFDRYPSIVCPRTKKTYRQDRLISADEMIGLIAHNPLIAKVILDYGKKHMWCFDNRLPGEKTLRSWQWRFLYAVPYYKIMAGEKPSWLEQVLFFIDIILASKNDYKETNAKLLYWVMSEGVSENGTWLMKKGLSIYFKNMQKMYCNNLGRFLGEYFPKDHPFVTYTLGHSIGTPKNVRRQITS